MIRLFAAIAFAAVLEAQPLKLPPELRQTVDVARAAPPEIAADALLRLIEAGKISDRPSRHALIEDAFTLGGAAHWKTPLRPLRPLPAETHEFYLAKAYALNLDALSLQTRAVKAMLATDPPKARELFLAIPHPVFDPPTCEAAPVADPAQLYEALGAIAGGAFTEAERAKDEHVKLLLAYIGAVTSPLEATPLAAAIPQARLTAEQTRTIQEALDSAVQAVQVQARALRCAGDFAEHADRFWQSPKAQHLEQAGSALRFENGAMVGPEQRATSAWQDKLTDFLKELADWGPGEEKSEADFFHEKCIVYQALLELTPRGPERDRILQDFANFLSGSDMENQSPAEWMLEARLMLDRVRNNNDGEPARVLEAYRASGNPALAVYVALQKIFGAAPSWYRPETAAP